eukprot:gene7789-8600_t
MAEEYEVLYDWEPENPEDLRLFAGETIVVLQTYDHGWWLGSVDREGEVMKGYFPRNYVKPLPRRVAPPAPRPPPRPLSLAATPLDVGKVAASVAALSVREEKAAAEQEEGRARPFSIKSLPAFDHLMEKGFSVEIDGASPSGSGSGSAESEAGPVLPRRGQEVSVDCVALLWDGAHSSAKEFTAGPLRFKLGKQAVVPGLEAALYSIPVGRSATVTCSPSMAYGSAGCPPLVPPNAFVVFLLTLQAVREPDEGEEEAVPQAPAGIFVSDLPQARRASLQRKRDRLVLSSSSSSAAQQSGFAFPDDAAAGTSASGDASAVPPPPPLPAQPAPSLPPSPPEQQLQADAPEPSAV